MYWITFLGPKVMAEVLINKKQKFACLHDQVRTTRPITTNLISYILIMVITWLNFR